MRFVLDERIRADGATVVTYAQVIDDRVVLRDEPGDRVGAPLSGHVIDRVMARYGRPLERAPDLAPESLDLGAGRALRRMRFHAVVDAEARDYLVYERPDGEPLAAIATMVTAAMRHLALHLASDS